MAANCSIRPVRPAERQALLDLWLALIEHHRKLGTRDAALERSAAGVREGLLQEVERALQASSCRVLVAEGETAGGLLGFVFAEREAGSVVCIHELFVVPAARRRNIGRELVEAALDAFAKDRPARFSVRIESANPEARRFWSALGFTERAVVYERPGLD